MSILSSVFSIGSCTSADAKSIKKTVKAINQSISLIKQSQHGTPQAPLGSRALDQEIKETKDAAEKIKGKFTNLDFKHKSRIQRSDAYRKMQAGMTLVNKIEQRRMQTVSTTSNDQRPREVGRSYLGMNGDTAKSG
ncbi:hypothetical protein K8D10_22620 [Aeromonas veronii]|uniref:hypothetical protein n=1 Tax=Aeromonas veronii TaxID=654 RepID=UPI00207CCB66|nr:hypothetical protein [Aeromonas veronii]MCO4174541.1 hypothetical protein [Aeromonas veronii]